MGTILDSVIFLEAHPNNFSHATRKTSEIKYLVVHYTGNVNDTARNNAMYYRDNNIEVSAHFFVSENSIYKSVQENHAAFAVGLGSRKTPYFKWPSHWKKCTNTNSISVEICGSRNSYEANDNVKELAAQLVAELCKKYSIPLANVIRHYDVTGKRCPAWAVDDPSNWLHFRTRVANYLYGEEEEDNVLNNEHNYQIFKEFMDRYTQELSAKPTPAWAVQAMTFVESKGLMNDGQAERPVTRAELATVLERYDGKK